MNTNEQIIYESLSTMINDILLVFDFTTMRLFIPNSVLISNFFLSNAQETYDYVYLKDLIVPNDIIFLKRAYDIIKNGVKDNFEPQNINYFSFFLRLKNLLVRTDNNNSLTFYVKLKPFWENGQLRHGIVLLSASVTHVQENYLYIYYKNMDYSYYSFRTNQWKHYIYSPLSKRQKEALIWAQQGLSLKETANKMNISEKTIENIRKTIFEKLGVNTIEQAIQYASNRRLIYHVPEKFT